MASNYMTSLKNTLSNYLILQMVSKCHLDLIHICTVLILILNMRRIEDWIETEGFDLKFIGKIEPMDEANICKLFGLLKARPI